jgi:cytochrome c551/c552
MALKDISLEDKVKIALDAIIGDVFGRGSSEVAQKYPGVSTRAVTTLKNQALTAIRDSFAGSIQAPSSGTMSDEEISAGLDRLLGGSPSAEDSDDDDEQPEKLLQVGEIVNAIMKYNDRAAKENKQRIYISRAIVQDVAHHTLKEIDEYFGAHKKTIDDHNTKHELKRNSNRALKGQDWQSWVEF